MLDSLIKVGDPEIHLSSDLSTYYTNFIMGNLGVKLLYSLFKLYQKMIVLKPAVASNVDADSTNVSEQKKPKKYDSSHVQDLEKLGNPGKSFKIRYVPGMVCFFLIELIT